MRKYACSVFNISVMMALCSCAQPGAIGAGANVIGQVAPGIFNASDSPSDTQVIATIQPNDKSLTCAELTDQMAQMDQIIGLMPLLPV